MASDQVFSSFGSAGLMPAIVERDVGGRVMGVVSGRELHAALGVATRVSAWLSRRVDALDLVEGVDYFASHLPRTGKIHDLDVVEFLFLVEAAKHVAMAERTDAGRAVRSYLSGARKRCASSRRDACASWRSASRRRRQIDHLGLVEGEDVLKEVSYKNVRNYGAGAPGSTIS